MNSHLGLHGYTTSQQEEPEFAAPEWGAHVRAPFEDDHPGLLRKPEPGPAAVRLHDAFIPSPLTSLDRLFGARSAVQVIAKLDLLQVSGSTKERTAASLLAGLMERGDLTPGGTVVESTSGNLGSALARQCALLGVRMVAVVDEFANVAALQAMKAYGAHVVRVPTPEDGNRLRARVRRVAELLEEIPGAVTTNQYGNADNARAHDLTTMPEFVAALGAPPDRMYVAVSTTGTLLGCQRAIERAGWPTVLVAVDAAGSVLFDGERGERRLPGLGAGFVTELSQHARPEAVRRISELDMVKGCRMLARREGILSGASTGAIVAAIGQDLESLDVGTTVGMLVHDGGLPYLPTVYDDEWVAGNLGDVDAIEAALERANPFSTR